jgi:hypothetical protein
MPKPFGRIRPYTIEEFRKFVPCAGCGKRSVHQWSCCANYQRKIPVCLDCDIALNEMALAFFRAPGRVKLLANYRRRVSPR